MYENARAGTSIETRGTGVNCPVAPAEQITFKCKGILEMSVIIESTAETIRTKMFGAQPQPERSAAGAGRGHAG
jgi:hypothetical protein